MPRMLRDATGRAVYIEAASAILDSQRVAFFGSPAWRWASASRFFAKMPFASDSEVPISILGAHAPFSDTATIINLPKQFGVMAWPRALRTIDGDVHLVWGSPLDANSDDKSSLQVLWHSVRRMNGWTDPDRVALGTLISWAYPFASATVRGNEIALAALARSMGNRSAILFATLHNGIWRADFHPVRGIVLGVAMSPFGADSTAVIWSEGDPIDREANGTHPWVVRVANSDTLWPVPRRISSSGMQSAVSLRHERLQSPEGLVRDVLLWAHIGFDDTTDSLRVVVSDDSWLSWHAYHGLALAGQFISLTSAGYSDRIHVAVQVAQFGGNRTRPLYVGSWSARAWELDTVPIATNVESMPQLARIDAQTFVLSWGASMREYGTTSYDVPVSMVSYFRNACNANGRTVRRRSE